MTDNRIFWVGFNLVKGIGSVRFRMLIDSFGDAQKAWNATRAELLSSGLNVELVENIINTRSNGSMEKVWNDLQAKKLKVLTWLDDEYPIRLREISNSPPVLYIRGAVIPQDAWAVAIVGTRRITAYGTQVAESVSSKLAQAGVTVISGLARGIDSVSHKSALDAGGRTIAVLGSGVDRIYPPEHRQLASLIMKNGAVVSDYPPGTPPEASNFPPRNRIISGLSLATVVVEAGTRSGALITANFAADQGRDVFAVPGNVFSPQSRGTNRLIRDGARVLLSPQEILEELELTRINQHRVARSVLPENATEAQLFGILSHEPLHVDDISNQTALSIETVTSSLALMELKGMVRQVGGMRYTAIKERRGSYDVADEGF